MVHRSLLAREAEAQTVDPKDFDQFWAKAIEEARWTKLEPTKTLLPERCTQDVNVYQVSFHNVRWGSRTYGILCEPVKPGKYPALLRVPGAGVRPYQGDVYTASQGFITLEIGIHGIDVTMPQSVYDNLADGALNCYWEFGMDDRDKSYYKRVIVGCVRAIDYIEQYTDWDGKNLGVTGSSQGGFLSLATVQCTRPCATTRLRSRAWLAVGPIIFTGCRPSSAGPVRTRLRPRVITMA